MSEAAHIVGPERVSFRRSFGCICKLLLSSVVLALCVGFAHSDGATDALERAVQLAGNGSEREALEIVRPLAESGNATAQHYLGVMLAAGQGLPKDFEEAVYWWHKAAAQGNQEAQHRLGVAYAGGFGVATDQVQGLKWLIVAGTEDTLTYSLLVQQLGSQDIARARSLALIWQEENQRERFRVARSTNNVSSLSTLATEGMADAQYYLGFLYELGYPDSVRSVGTFSPKPNHEAAVKLYRQAAIQNHAEAQYQLYGALASGTGTEKNEQEALEWLRKAVDGRHGGAAFSLALRYENGNGVRRDTNKARELYQKAIELGDEEAMLEMGRSYFGGRFTEIDFVYGYMWFTVAIDFLRIEYPASYVAKFEEELREISSIMTQRQIEQSKLLAQKCKVHSYKRCEQRGILSYFFRLFD